jgi:nitrogen fixation-related uncharacterized protein
MAYIDFSILATKRKIKYMYFYLFIYFIIGLVFVADDYLKFNKKIKNSILISFFFLLLIFLGFRDKTGADWETYLHYYNLSDSKLLSFNNDILYYFFSLLIFNLDLGFHFIIFITTLFFLIALFKYYSLYENQFLLLIASFPVVIILLSTGYIRQSIAFSFFLFFLYSIQKHKKNKFLLILLGGLFHSSILIFSLFFLILYNKKKIIFFSKKYLLILVSVFILFIIFIFIFLPIKRYIDQYGISSYVTSLNIYQTQDSPGLVYRSVIILIPVTIFLTFYRKILFNNEEEKKVLMTLIQMFLIFLPFSGFSTTLFDRIYLYLSFLPGLLYLKIFNKFNFFYIKLFFLIFYGMIILIWFKLSNHASYWSTYYSILF